MNVKIGNDEWTEMQLKFYDSCNASAFVTLPKVGGTHIYLTAAIHVVITQKFWELNEQWQAFARVVRSGQTRVPHTMLANMGPSGYDIRASNLHQHSSVAQMFVPHGFISRPNITTWTITCILESREHHIKQLPETGDTFQSEELSSKIVKNSSSMYASLDI